MNLGLSVGLGFREELAADLLRAPGAVDFVEVVAESCFVKSAARREAKAVSELWPVIPHGVKLSLGDAEGIDPDRARALGALARELGSPLISEHIAFVRSGHRELGHLTGLPFTRAALSVVCRNVARARRYLPDIPLLLENIAWSFCWPESDIDEADFYCEIAERTGCPMLLDVSNLYANAINSGRDPLAFARAFPLERVGMIHLAGGVLEHGFYFDDHAHSVSSELFALLQLILERTGPVPLLIERDALFPPFAELRAEVERCRALLRTTGPARPLPRPLTPAPLAALSAPEVAALTKDQGDIAGLLIDLAPSLEGHRFDQEAIVRSRAMLQRKRVDEALPLLPLLAPYRAEVVQLAQQVVAQCPRPARLAAISDALEIARRATKIASLAAAAERDLLVLEIRFVRDPNTHGVRPRQTPFLGVRHLMGGARVLALKGFGANAQVHFYERR